MNDSLVSLRQYEDIARSRGNEFYQIFIEFRFFHIVIEYFRFFNRQISFLLRQYFNATFVQLLMHDLHINGAGRLIYFTFSSISSTFPALTISGLINANVTSRLISGGIKIISLNCQVSKHYLYPKNNFDFLC